MGIEPIVTTAAEATFEGQARGGEDVLCCEPKDMADLVEYCWGNASTPMGKQRIEDGHPAPFRLKYIELGNEQCAALTRTYLSACASVLGGSV